MRDLPQSIRTGDKKSIVRADTVVIGGGPAGISTALALSQLGQTVVVLERSSYDSVRVGETLPPPIQALLGRLGVWEYFLKDGHVRSPGIISAWGSDECYETDFILNPYGMGWHIDRTRFDKMLASAAERTGAAVYQAARVVSCIREPSGLWKVDASCHGRDVRFQADFLVESVGRSSSLAGRGRMRRLVCDQLVGIVGFFESRGDAHCDRRTLVEASENGWWYSALLPGNKLIIAYMTDADQIPRHPALLAGAWHGNLARAPHTRMREASGIPSSRLRIISANSYRRMNIAGAKCLAVGDAATAFDPLSSQGIYRAIQGGLYAARAILEYQRGHSRALLDYQSEIERIFMHYLDERAGYYAQERRWPNSEFWRRRQSPPARSAS